jgi:hypothetical protein
MKTFIRSLTLGALTLGLALMAPTHATAQVTEYGLSWTAAASTCVPGGRGTLDRYGFAGGDFYFDGAAVSASSVLGPVPIIVRCHVTQPPYTDRFNPVTWDMLIVGFQDPDGVTSNATMIARLMRISRPTGIASSVVSFNSNTGGLTTRHERGVKFQSSAVDFFNYEYYVEILLYRTSTAVASPRAYSVRLATTTTNNR